MPRPTRRHARKASATTAEEILLPAELMAGLTSTLSLSEPPPHHSTSTTDLLAADTGSTDAGNGSFEPANDPITPAGLELAPLFPLARASSENEAISAGEDTQLNSSNDTTNDNAAPSESAATAEPKSILKEPRADDSNGSRWSLWPGAKKWLSGTLMLNARDEQYPTFDAGAGIPAGRQSSEEDAAAAAAAALSRTAPSLDFERSTNFVPPLSQERIKSTEFWTNFALELDPSRLKRIRFSMPLIITEFDPELSRVCDTDDPLLTSLETTTRALRNCLDKDDAIESLDELETTNGNEQQNPADDSAAGGDDHDDGQHVTENQSSNSSRSSMSIHSIQPTAWQHHPLQWDVEALSQRQYRVQEVWEIYERTCRTFDIEPLSSFEKILLQHVREDQVLGIYLDISRNPVCGPETAVLEVLSQVIGQNQTLRGLFMSATAMTSEGAIALAECLPDLHNLERLDVSENPGIDVAGLMALSASIKLNKSLICVEITVNTGDDVCAALEQSIAQVCIANMQRMDATSAKSIDLDFSPQTVHVWSHADFAPESDIPGVVATKVSSENDRYECTSLVTDIAAVKRTSIASTNDAADQSQGD
ncbi:hypothetical protein IWW42_003111 [Coemansia sp. RSA 1085]|nr:hypothetical protein IWW42_003111 [Coemansia sp. RSA 1085]